MTSPESRSIQKHFADLNESIQNPTTLAGRLYSADLLSQESRKKVCSRALIDSDKVCELLDATEVIIQQDPSNFYKFVEALEKDSSMQHLCGKLRSTCAQLKSLHTPQLVSSLPPNTSAAQQSSDSMIPSSITSSSHSTTKATCTGLRLRSGRTLPDPLSLIVESDGDTTKDGAINEIEDETEQDDIQSINSSCSNWSAEQKDLLVQSSDDDEEETVKKKRAKKKQKISSDDLEERESNSSLLEDNTVSEWLKLTKPVPSPYFPQIYDIVMYCLQGHKLYCEAVKYQWTDQQMPPWEQFTLRCYETCRVKEVEFDPSENCSITFELLSPRFTMVDNQQQTFTITYHNINEVLDFIILKQIYRNSLKYEWSVGDRIKCFIDDRYWYGTIVEKRPYRPYSSQVWQSCLIQWDNGDPSQYLSPWEFLPLDADDDDGIFKQKPEWEDECVRIFCGLDDILKKKVLEDEASGFLYPVDLDKHPLYSTVVAFTTSISTIAERLSNGFYRRKSALIWEVKLLLKNAIAYNEDDSLIVENGRIVVKTLLKFIRTPSCNNVMKCYPKAENLRPDTSHSSHTSEKATHDHLRRPKEEKVIRSRKRRAAFYAASNILSSSSFPGYEAAEDTVAISKRFKLTH